MSPARLGHTLVELLVALPLAALLLALLTLQLVSTARSARHADALTRRARDLRHALGILTTELRPLAPTTLTHWSDTLLAFDAPIMVALACAHPARDALVLVPTAAAHPARPWRTTPAPDDLVTAWQVSPNGQATATYQGAVASLQRTTPCTLDHHPPRPAWRLDLRTPLPATITPGLPVRLARPVRYRLYRTTDGWFLGRQTRVRLTWESTQPLAGPLDTPALGGMRVRAWDSLGAPLPPGTTTPHHLHLTLRAPAEPTGSAHPTPPLALTAAVTLRGTVP